MEWRDPLLRKWSHPLASLSWDAVQLWPPSLGDVKPLRSGMGLWDLMDKPCESYT